MSVATKQLKELHMDCIILNRDGGTGLADLATVGPMFAVWCLKSQQMQSQRS